MRTPRIFLALLCAALITPLSADTKDWSVLLYGNANGLGTQMLNSLAQGATRVRDKTTNVMVHCQYGNRHAWRFKLSDGAIKIKDHIDWVDTYSADNPLVEAFADLQENYPAKHYAVILMGFGSGKVDLSWSWENNRWEWPENPVPRGILYDPESSSHLSTSQLVNAFRRMHEEILVDQKVDVLATDACAMNSAELLGDLSNDVSFFCGTQDEQPLEGLPYNKIFNLLNMQELSPRAFASGIVDAFAEHYTLFGPGHPVSYSALNLERLPMVHNVFQEAVELLQHALDAAPGSLLGPMFYEQRNMVTESKAFPEYIDVYHWLTSMEQILADAGSLVTAETRQQYWNLMVRLKDMFHGPEGRINTSNLIVNHCALMREEPTFGLNLYYPRTWDHLASVGDATTWTRFMVGSSTYLESIGF